MENLKGKISVSRFSTNKEPYHGISIEITDESSGTLVVEVTMTPEQFGNAISGLGHVECLFDFGNSDLIGKRREAKTVAIPLNKSPYKLQDSEIDDILADYEVNGWKARRSDFKNSHKYGKDLVNVVFVRFVDAPVEVE